MQKEIQEHLDAGFFVRVREHHVFDWKVKNRKAPFYTFDHVVAEDLDSDLIRVIVESERAVARRLATEDPTEDFYITKFIAPKDRQNELDEAILEYIQEEMIKHNSEVNDWINSGYMVDAA